MGIKLYNSERIAIEDLGGYIITAHNGIRGESVDVLLYLSNDDASIYYNNISITIVDSNSPDDTLGVYGSGRGVKLSEGARQPNETEWNNVLAGDFIDMPEIGSTDASDTTTYFPFWIRVIVPGNIEIQTFTDLSLEVTASEHLTGT